MDEILIEIGKLFIGLAIGWFLIFLIIRIFFGTGKKAKINDDNKYSGDEDKRHYEKATDNVPKVVIPDTCPHCKNPNRKRIRLCEWCGDQIF